MNASGDFEIVVTRGGARAVRDRTTGEVMHPVIGPRAEAESLYVGASRLRDRLREPSPSPLVLLDVGLGGGSNAVAAWRASAETETPGRRRLAIVSFDRTVDALAMASRSEHRVAFGFDGAVVPAIERVQGGGVHECDHATWRIVLGELPQTLAGEPDGFANVVFWDPFSPRANPELWTAAAFGALRRLCRAGATVHTYSRATAVRSALLLAGFAVGVGDATGEKEDTTIAAVDVSSLRRPLDRRWLARLARSSAPLPSDAPPGALELVASRPQFA